MGTGKVKPGFKVEQHHRNVKTAQLTFFGPQTFDVRYRRACQPVHNLELVKCGFLCVNSNIDPKSARSPQVDGEVKKRGIMQKHTRQPLVGQLMSLNVDVSSVGRPSDVER